MDIYSATADPSAAMDSGSDTQTEGFRGFAPDGDPNDLFTVTNTPLTVQRQGLVTVSGEEWEDSQRALGFLGAGHTDELAWVIPMVIGIVLVIVVLALLFFYGVRALELKFARCCYRNFRCCAPEDGSLLGDELDSLTSKGRRQSTERKANYDSSGYDWNT